MKKEIFEKIAKLNDALNSAKRLQDFLDSDEKWSFDSQSAYYHPSDSIKEKIKQFANDEVARLEK